MENATPAGYVVPNPRIPKVLGLLNIVFASAILLCGLCMGIYAMMLPMLGKAIITAQKGAEKAQEDQKKAELKMLDDEEKAAKTEEEKADVRARRDELNARAKVNMALSADMFTMGMDDRTVQVWIWTELVTGLVVNVMMIAAGIGLVSRKSWGLRLGIWTVVAKLIRLPLLYGIFAIAVVPHLGKAMARVAIKSMALNPQFANKPLPPQIDEGFFARTYTIMYTISAVGMIIFGVIYPAISLWLLTRPGARAACSGAKMPGEDGDSW